jgi:hypothetical protein
MKWSPHWPLHAADAFTEREVAPSANAWWLGWLKLLCAWLLCMLLCANVALVLERKLPEGRCRTVTPSAAYEPGTVSLPGRADRTCVVTRRAE